MQHELFKEFEDGKRRSKAPHSLLARPASVVMPLEKVVFISIGIIMALVIVHALGIERGKAIARHEGDKITARSSRTAVLDSGQYTVLIATYRQRSAADAEMGRLNKDGYSAFLIGREGSLNLCVGRFSSPGEAALVKDRLRSRYKNCSVSRITKRK